MIMMHGVNWTGLNNNIYKHKSISLNVTLVYFLLLMWLKSLRSHSIVLAEKEIPMVMVSGP